MSNKFRRKTYLLFSKINEFKYLFLFLTLIAAVFILAPKLASFFEKALIIPRFTTSLLFNKEIELKKEEDQAINILLLGIAGGKHQGATLTDTIIFAHIDPKENKVALVSIPRDLWAPVLQSKINAAYEFGEEKRKGGGLALAKATIADLLSQPVHYAFRIDFSGFVKIVDQVGGLDIEVDRTFDDFNYPIPGKEDDLCGKTEEEVIAIEATLSAAPTNILLAQLFPCRVEHLHFDKGPIHIDGETTLKYVRSRQAQGAEGDDFARSRRQQKVLLALRDKILSAGVLLNPFKLIQLGETLGRSIDTNIASNEYDDFIKLAQKMINANVKSIVIDQGDEKKEREGLLINPPIREYGTWVLTPRTGDFAEIQDYIACELIKDDCVIDKL